MREPRHESAAVIRFRKLSEAYPEREVLRLLAEWHASRNLPDTVRRNLTRFVTGEGREVSDRLRPHLLAFCREGLKIEVEETEFDLRDRRRDFGAEFSRANANSRSLLEDACGKYSLLRPRTSQGKIVRNRKEGEDYHPWDAEISRGVGTTFNYELWLEERIWSGRAYSSLGVLYLFAIENKQQNIVSAILAPMGGDVHHGVLVGTMLMNVTYHEPGLKVSHSLAAARPVALARKGAGSRKRNEKAIQWLDEQVASGSGFCIPLLETLLSPTYESP